ncbi:nucleotidyltransferase domain-containing protein [Candidatus Bipolaricaulota bacterium]|nr:nucleotidyltransferase domain-containing protein [Candidatus Bipolaricaulota bacterium]
MRRYKEELRRLGIEPEKVIVYGSRAKGILDKESDIDVVVISKDFARMGLRERLELLGVAAARIMEPVQALGYTSEEYASLGEGTFVGDEVKPVGIEA